MAEYLKELEQRENAKRPQTGAANWPTITPAELRKRNAAQQTGTQTSPWLEEYRRQQAEEARRKEEERRRREESFHSWHAVRQQERNAARSQMYYGGWREYDPEKEQNQEIERQKALGREAVRQWRAAEAQQNVRPACYPHGCSTCNRDCPGVF